MQKFWGYLILFFVSLSAFGNTSTQLSRRWSMEKKGLINDYSEIPRDRHVLFVSGIENELAGIISNYFPDNIQAVEAFGLTTSYFAPSSRGEIPVNSNLVCREITHAYFKFGNPLIVMAHSKGGAETLHCLLNHPDLILNGIVDRVVLLQPAVGGSPLVDGTHGWVLTGFLTLLGSDLDTLRTEVAENNFNLAFHNYRKIVGHSSNQHEIVSKRIFYVRSYADPDRLSKGVRIVLNVVRKYLTHERSMDGINPNENISDPWRYSGLNDGLLPVEAQLDSRVGTDLGFVESDHIGLTVSLVSNISRADRRAFTRAVLSQIYSPKQ